MSTQEHFYSEPGRLQGQHLTWIGEMGDDASVLPVDFKKETVRKAGYPHKTPKKGDEVRVHYTGSSKGSVFDTSRDGKPFAFTLGIGEVMEAWDRAVATMKAGELARFMVPEMYLAGGAPSVLAKIPDESVVTYEIELLGFTSITDLFEDGGVVKTVEKDGEDYGRQPKAGEEVCMDFEVLVDGEMVDKRRLDYKIGLSRTEGLIPHKVLDKALLAMKRCEVVLLRCRSEYAFGDVGAPERGVPAGCAVTVRLTLIEIYEIEDVGKKVHWAEGLVIKKATKVVRDRLVPGMDGTRCTVRVRATCGEEEIAGEQTIEAIPGDGTLCDALECACARMRKGETAVVTVQDVSLCSPGLPTTFQIRGGPVLFHVEMMDFDHPAVPDDGPRNDRLEFCQEQKNRGSAHFRKERYRLALERYARVVDLLPLYKREGTSSVHVDFFEDAADRQVAQELRIACRLNLGASALKLEEFYAAARYCDEVLKDEPTNLKALYRRAQAYVGTKDFEKAGKDCRRILDLHESHNEAQALLQRIARLEKEEARKQRAAFGGKLYCK